jgi:hypothetical protein
MRPHGLRMLDYDPMLSTVAEHRKRASYYATSWHRSGNIFVAWNPAIRTSMGA